MAHKRKIHPPATSSSPTKRRRYDDDDTEAEHEARPSFKAEVDPTYGQRSAFPGLDDGPAAEHDLFYGPAEDGLNYLRMVRYVLFHHCHLDCALAESYFLFPAPANPSFR